MSLTKEAQDQRRAEFILNSNVNSTTKGDLVPFLPNTVELVYGGMDYARSVLGPEITRNTIIDYFDNAKKTWPCTSVTGLARSTIVNWCKQRGIKPLHYVAPMGIGKVWFREETDLFAFKLRFGV